ncbi:hypothetical protein ANN_15308 [Periplaneta americana]|uniref:Uncharacterized protein n=1 Tax=Periplaneta americana TaxID=6978 RepID=A0ABQ8SGU4_PERAM|nr:hypothetical protein ANN_15308 [Periplaneta americana]
MTENRSKHVNKGLAIDSNFIIANFHACNNDEIDAADKFTKSAAEQCLEPVYIRAVGEHPARLNIRPNIRFSSGRLMFCRFIMLTYLKFEHTHSSVHYPIQLLFNQFCTGQWKIRYRRSVSERLSRRFTYEETNFLYIKSSAYCIINMPNVESGHKVKHRRRSVRSGAAVPGDCEFTELITRLRRIATRIARFTTYASINANLKQTSAVSTLVHILDGLTLTLKIIFRVPQQRKDALVHSITYPAFCLQDIETKLCGFVRNVQRWFVQVEFKIIDISGSLRIDDILHRTPNKEMGWRQVLKYLDTMYFATTASPVNVECYLRNYFPQ